MPSEWLAVPGSYSVGQCAHIALGVVANAVTPVAIHRTDQVPRRQLAMRFLLQEEEEEPRSVEVLAAELGV